MGSQYVTQSMGGGGEASYFYIYRSLSDEILKTISNLEGLFHQVFRQVTYFQEQLDTQSGKAASTLKKNVNNHIEFIVKSAPVLLNFADIVKSLIVAVESTDAGDGDMSLVAPTGRMEWQYSLSVERIEEDVRMDAHSITLAALQFKTNLVNIDELFSEYSKMLEKVITDSYLPWGGLMGIWSESLEKVESITETTKEQIEKLVKDTNQFVAEMTRLDNMAGSAMIQV